jgi:cation:H+ antiporter
MPLFSLLLLIVGLIIVILTADIAIKRLLNLSQYFRLSEFTTSFIIAGIVAVLPELSIGIIAALEGSSSLGFGVILGANVADLTLVLGLVLLLSKRLTLDSSTIKHIRISILSLVLPVLLFIDGEISRKDGLILVGVFVIYIIYMLKTKSPEDSAKMRSGRLRFAADTATLLLSLVLLFVGGNIITGSSQDLSIQLGLPLFVIGLVVAIGTCLPELAFALRAARTKHAELGLGNIFGNVLADSMFTIGLIAFIQPIKPAQPIFALSTGVFMVFSGALVALLSRKRELTRIHGVVLTVCFLGFIVLQYFLEEAALVSVILYI